ncbi:TolC family protein, partial [Sphingobium jiangsuense]
MRSPLSLLPLLALAACTAGPDYQGPASAGAAPQRFARAGEAAIPAAPAVAPWWTALGDPLLDELERRALADSPSIAIAQAKLTQARSALRLDRANGLPNANAQLTYAHARLPGIDLGSSGDGEEEGGGDGSSSEALNFYNLGFDASWEIDLFGGHRRTMEASRASLEAAQASIADAQVSLAAEVAGAYVHLRDRQQRLALAEQSAARQREVLDLTRQRQTHGTVSALEVERQRSLAEQADAALLPLRAERDAYLNALAVLTGQAPGAVDAMLAGPGAIPLPPA